MDDDRLPPTDIDAGVDDGVPAPDVESLVSERQYHQGRPPSGANGSPERPPNRSSSLEAALRAQVGTVFEAMVRTLSENAADRRTK